MDAFVEEAIRQSPGVSAAVACFYAVRDLPYAMDGEHDAPSLMIRRRGDCLAKSELLRDTLAATGGEARLVRWAYLLPLVVPEAQRLPSRLDMHRAVQLRTQRGWMLVDATHHLGLAGSTLIVAEWDGTAATPPAHAPIGPIMVEDTDVDDIKGVLRQIESWVSDCPPPLLQEWRSSYIDWLRLHE